MTEGHAGGGHHSPTGSSGGLAISTVQPRVYFGVETPPSGRLSPALGMMIGVGGERELEDNHAAGGGAEDVEGNDGGVQMDLHYIGPTE